MTTQTEIANHADISERFLQHAWEQFEIGDLPQASEKAWGAVAHYLKAEAKFRGWRNASHRDLSDIAYDLAQETANPHRIHELYGVMTGMHANFYEDWFPAPMVARGIHAAAELISRLDNRTLPPVEESRPSQVSRQRTRDRLNG